MAPAIAGIAFVVLVFSLIRAGYFVLKRNGARVKRAGIWSTSALAVVIGASLLSPSTSDSGKVSVTHADAAPAVEAATKPQPEQPAARPVEKSRQQLKREFLETVDETINGKRIAGNKQKFVGKRVDLHGKVVNVLDEHTFNYQTGAVSMDDEGNVADTSAMLVVTCDSTRSLEGDQSLRVIGTVTDPMDGTNAMGGSMGFPTVHAEFME